MRVLIDTNILVSASLSSEGTPYQAYIKAVTHPNHGIVCDQNIDELRRVYNRKFPHKIQVLERFLTIALTVLEVVSTPAIKVSDEELIRDTSDRPILRAYCGKS
jgi:predicted nucleic acid-binding protein